MATKPDIDPQETQEWLDALDGVLENEGVDRAHLRATTGGDVDRSGGYPQHHTTTRLLWRGVD